MSELRGIKVDGKNILIQDINEYMKTVEKIYEEELGYNLEPIVKNAIKEHIEKNGGRLKIFDGAPGLHADIIATNYGISKTEHGLQLAVFKVSKTTKGKGKQGYKFPACKNCGGIMELIRKKRDILETTSMVGK